MLNKENKYIFFISLGLILFISFVILLNIYLYKTHTTALKDEIKNELLSVFYFKERQILEWFQQSQRYVNLLKRTAYFDKMLYDLYLKGSSSKDFTELTENLKVFYQNGYIDAVLIVDTNYQIIYKNKTVDKKNYTTKLSNNLIQKIKDFKDKFNEENETYAKSKNKNIKTFISKIENTDFEINKNEVNFYIITPFVKPLGENYNLIGFLVFSANFNQLAPILKNFGSGNKKFTTELVKSDNYQAEKVVRIVGDSLGNYKIERGISNIPIFYLPKQEFHQGIYEGFDRNNEYVVAKIRSANFSKFLIIVKINLAEHLAYKKIFALYLGIFTFIIILGSLVLIYIFGKYYKNINYKKEYDLLLQRQEIQIRYETLLKNANDAIILYDEEGKIFEFNDRFVNVFGKRNDVLIKNIKDLFYEKGSDNKEEIILNTNLFDGTLIETVIKDKTDNPVPVEISIRTIKFGNFLFNQAIIRDISERKNNEIALTESKEKYKNLVENINDVIFNLDSKGNIIYISPVIYNLIGYTSDEVLNTNLINYTSNENSKILYKLFKDLHKKNNIIADLTLNKKNGELCYVKVSARLNRIDAKNYFITGILTDITYEKELELMLEKERKDLRTIIELSPVAIYFKDKYNNYIKVNKAAAEISNLTVEEMQGKSAKDIFPLTHDIYYKEDLEIMYNGLPKFGITEKLEINGKVLWLRSDKVPWYNEKGEVAGVVCFTVDITEQTKAENELIKEKELLRLILKTIPVGVIYVEVTGKILFGNEAAERIFEIPFSKERLPELNSFDIKFYDSTGKEIELEKNPLLNNEIAINSNNEYTYIRKDNKKLILSINKSLIKDNLGNVEGIVASIEDITKRKEYEVALIESEKRYRTLFESMQEGFGLHEIICDKNGKPIDYRFLEVNPAFEKLTGLKAKDITNKTAKKVLPKLEYYWVEIYGKVALNKEYVEFENYSKDLGKYFKVSAFAIGEGIFAVLFEDVTEKKKIEKELEKHRQELELRVKVRTKELNRINLMLAQEVEKSHNTEEMLKKTLDEVQKFSDLKTRFISTASHEFRTPLTTISSSIQLLSAYGRKCDEKKYNEHIQRVLKTIDNLTELINDVLLVSRVESGKIDFKPKNEDLFEFCSKIVEELNNDYAKNHILDFRYNTNRKEFMLDLKLLRSVLTNLLTNAIKYSPDGEVILFTVESDDDFIKMIIKDNGIGMSKEDISHLFEPFHRGKNVAEISGTGLGMSIVKRYLDLQKGEISVISEINKGTIVKVLLPINITVKDESISN